MSGKTMAAFLDFFGTGQQAPLSDLSSNRKLYQM